MNKILLILCLVATFIQGKSQSPTNTLTLITDYPHLRFYYHDSLGYGHNVVIKTRETKVYINTPVLLFEASDMQVPFYVKPNETILIRKNKKGEAVFEALKNEQRTNELLLLKTLTDITGTLYNYDKRIQGVSKAIDANQLKKYRLVIEKKEQERMALIDSFSSKQSLSNEFKLIAKQLCHSSAIADQLLLCRDNIDLLKATNNYDNWLVGAYSENMQTVFSTLFLDIRPTMLFLQLKFGKEIDLVIKSEDDLQQKLAFINQSFFDASKSFLIARCIYTSLLNKIPIDEATLNNAVSNCADIGYKKLLLSKLGQLSITSKLADNALVGLTNEVASIDSVFGSKKGRLVYIDFWASWCSPCRAEMKFSKKLISQFKNKNIDFMFISIDEDADNWKRAVAEESLYANSFLLANHQLSYFAKKIELSSIPRYIILSKEGKIINSNAPRPSDKNLVPILEKLLAE